MIGLCMRHVEPESTDTIEIYFVHMVIELPLW